METIKTLVDVARHLSDIQVEGVEDRTGFSNADKHVGAFLANVVASDPKNTENVRALAGLVSKYRRQVEALTSKEFFAEVKALSQDSSITQEQRAAARLTIIATPGTSDKVGPCVWFSCQYSQVFIYTLKEHGGRGYKDGDGFKWAVPANQVNACVTALKNAHATIVGSVEIPADIQAAPFKAEPVGIQASIEGRNIVLAFKYDKTIVEAVRSLPTRRFYSERKVWTFPIRDYAIAVETLENSGADVSALRALESQVPDINRAMPTEDAASLSPLAIATLRSYQQVGVKFLIQTLAEVRKQVPGGAEVRGFILGDDMGLGKTLESMFAADALLAENEKALIVCPASVKGQWVAEIHKYLGENTKVSVIETETKKYETRLQVWEEKKDAEGKVIKGEDDEPVMVQVWRTFKGSYPVDLGIDPQARYVVTNYDTLLRDYELIAKMGFAILILDEAHYIKNRDSIRAKLVIGGQVKNAPQVPTESDPRQKRLRKYEGLAMLATKRVYAATGSPLMNKPKDLFNLLRAVGHPLGRNFKKFGTQYCDPMEVWGKHKKMGTTYEGASNIEDLRRKIAPIFIQRKKRDVLTELPPITRSWVPVEVDLRKYKAKMEEYADRRRAGELSSDMHHLALLNEARMCVAVSKIPASIEMTENAIEQGEKALLFTNFSETIDEFAKHFGEKAVVIDGRMTGKQKDEAKHRIQNDDSVRVGLINIKAGGVGLNLQAASQVFFNDLEWVPKNHEQAWCRADRFGQTRPVNVTFLLAAGTIDEPMAIDMEGKFAVSNAFEGLSLEESLFHRLVERLAEESTPQNRSLPAAHKPAA